VGVRRRERNYQQLDALRPLRQQGPAAATGAVPQTSRRKMAATQIPYVGPVRAALLIAPDPDSAPLRTKRQPCAYSGLALETRTSGKYRLVGGEFQRSKKQLAIRGLNQNHNHDLKYVFKNTESVALTDGRSGCQTDVGRIERSPYNKLTMEAGLWGIGVFRLNAKSNKRPVINVMK
jgi:hypothetical protein